MHPLFGEKEHGAGGADCHFPEEVAEQLRKELKEYTPATN